MGCAIGQRDGVKRGKGRRWARVAKPVAWQVESAPVAKALPSASTQTCTIPLAHSCPKLPPCTRRPSFPCTGHLRRSDFDATFTLLIVCALLR